MTKTTTSKIQDQGPRHKNCFMTTGPLYVWRFWTGCKEQPV